MIGKVWCCLNNNYLTLYNNDLMFGEVWCSLTDNSFNTTVCLSAQRRPGGPRLLTTLVYSMLYDQAVRKCVERLLLVQQDFFKHVSGLQSPHPVLFRYQHMFKGIKVGDNIMFDVKLRTHQQVGRAGGRASGRGSLLYVTPVEHRYISH